MIRQKGDKWVLFTRDGSRILGTHDTLGRAQAQEKAIMVNKNIKQADLFSLPVPQSVLREAESGDPGSAAELKNIEEAYARRVFSRGKPGRSSISGRALLGRVRDPLGTLTSREEDLLERHPELKRLAAVTQPTKTYPISRLLTHPGMAAIPAAGAGAGLARLIAHLLGAEGPSKEIATAGGAAIGGVVGSGLSHAARQRHARNLARRMGELEKIEGQSVKEAEEEPFIRAIPYFLSALSDLS